MVESSDEFQNGCTPVRTVAHLTSLTFVFIHDIDFQSVLCPLRTKATHTHTHHKLRKLSHY